MLLIRTLLSSFTITYIHTLNLVLLWRDRNTTALQIRYHWQIKGFHQSPAWWSSEFTGFSHKSMSKGLFSKEAHRCRLIGKFPSGCDDTERLQQCSALAQLTVDKEPQGMFSSLPAVVYFLYCKQTFLFCQPTPK